MRRRLKSVALKNGYRFDGKKIYVQSMLNKPSRDVEANVLQAKQLEKAGCDIVRVAVPSFDDLHLIPAIKNQVKIPVVADIHFDHRLAVESVGAGADKIRINPGNIGDESKVKEVVWACKNANVPIRIGVNSGSLEKHLLYKYSGPKPEALLESALNSINMLEKFDFNDIIVSVKSSDVVSTIKVYRMLSEMCEYPLHLGVTESGTRQMGVLKSAIGIGSLLADEIGETIRVSLTGDPVEEIRVARDILKSVNLEKNYIKVVSCPTCGRTKIDIINLTKKIEKELENVKKPLKVAIMGCVVNGPGEAKDADIGIAGGDGQALLFKKGRIERKIEEGKIVEILLDEIKKM